MDVYLEGPNFPKIFRRQATFWTQIPGPLTGAQFYAMLKKGAAGKGDRAYTRSYFLANINKLDPHQRIKLITKIGSQGQTNFDPPDLVFQEDPSSLLKGNGQKVTSW